MYRTIDARFWTDPKVKKLTPEGKLLFLYLITNPLTHVSGIYVLNLSYLPIDLSISEETLSSTINTLSQGVLIEFDPVTDVMWVKKMMGYQGKGDNAHRSAAYHIMEDLHDSYLCDEFLKAYPAVSKYVTDDFKLRIKDKKRTPFGGPPPPGSLPTLLNSIGTLNSREHRTVSGTGTVREQGAGSVVVREKHVDRPRDLASDFFAEKSLLFTACPYVPAAPDFIMLAKLRKAFKIEHLDMPPGWEAAVENYFASPLSQYSLADLANPKRYAVFRNSPLDKFNKPSNHGAVTHEPESKSAAQQRRINQRAEEINQRILAENTNRHGAGNGSGSSLDVHRHPE